MGKHYKIRTEKTGHYFTHGLWSGDTKYIWICLHGYGQLAKYFIQRFEFLDPAKHYVIAPEGLNRFYFEGLNDRPVAGWMTREDRLDEIADFVLFLNALREKIGWEKSAQAKIIYFGFSQGVATMMRWLSDSAPRVDYLLLWAGGLPDDILYAHRRDYFSQTSAHFFMGDEDPYIREQDIEEKKPLFFSTGMRLQLHSYAGGHKMDEEVLKQWVENHC